MHVLLGDARFEKATFEDFAWFSDAGFMEHARFINATFNREASFEKATFEGYAGFEKATFEGKAGFSDATFKGGAEFTNAQFDTLTDFQNTVFHRPPLFHNAPLHQDTRFNAGDGIADQLPNITDDEAERAYRTLKLHMAANQAHREEQFFFRQEMRARRRHERWWRRPLYDLYGAVSDYGQSFGRPLVAWFVLLILMARLHLDAMAKPTHSLDNWQAAFTLALGNTLPLGGFARQATANAIAELYGSPQAIPDCLPLFSNLHTLLSAILLFLAVLALRNLFRMK